LGGRLLIGVDLVKDTALLEAAYNDARGVTADFSLNLLARINPELGSEFDLGAFAHRAFFNPDPEPDPNLAAPRGPDRIEMHLVRRRDQQVRVGDWVFGFRAGESIRTESSYKHDLDGFRRLAGRAGFLTEQVWTDRDRLFSVHCLRAGPR
jgi:L-histidine Nalpha-methyltransferase